MLKNGRTNVLRSKKIQKLNTDIHKFKLFSIFYKSAV